jgi:energy-converting hydrogenase Eha subunit B
MDKGNGNESDPGYDLALMSLSDHVILSYGTYGMMAGYFSKGKSIAISVNFNEIHYLLE